MDGALRLDDLVRALRARDPAAAATYHRLPDEARRAVLARLGEKELVLLTGLVKEARKRVFLGADHELPSIVAGIADTPAYLLDERLIEENMRVLQYVKDRTGARVLHALKAYASFATFPVMRSYLDGTCASGLNEARLGYEEFKKEVHVFGAAYKEKDFRRMLRYCSAVIFNSFPQLASYAPRARRSGVQTGLRVNPGHGEVASAMYNPCGPCSRLGVTYDVFRQEFPRLRHMVDGLHFHALCEQNSDVLERVVTSFEGLYGAYLDGLRWVNFGGGHHITRDDYDLERLIRLVKEFKERYHLEVYLEPGEASVYHAGFLVSSVLDIVRNEMAIAILDASAETHMPDVLLMPYRPEVRGAGGANEKKHTYRLAGPSCLAGDVVGDYSFDEPLSPGDRLLFRDMALYSIVKSTTFNGINLPDIVLIRQGGRLEVVRKFGYRDYRDRQS